MTKQKHKYGLRVELVEYHDNEQITAICLLDYFELTGPEEILEVIGFFTENLKLYLEKHNIGC